MKVLRQVGWVVAAVTVLVLCLPYIVVTTLGVWLHSLQEWWRGRRG